MRPYILIVFLVLAAAVSSCASPIASQYRKEATPNLTFPMVYQDPAAHKGSFVIWGGSIIRTINTASGSEMFVLETPLGSRDWPESIEYSRGRFIVTSTYSLDPLVYHRGKRVTVAGEVVGTRQVKGKKSGVTFTYPVVRAKQIYLWKRAHYHAYPYYYSGYGWWGEPYYWGGPYFDEGPGFGEGEDEGFGNGEEGEGGEGDEGGDEGR